MSNPTLCRIGPTWDVVSQSAELFAARVPRYTSYPTAPHFHIGVDASTYRSWLKEFPPDLSLSLYLHVPFCDTLCWFCGCHTTVVNRYAPVQSYLDLVACEIDLLADALGTTHPVSHLHWGGGSPTMMWPDHVISLARTLGDRFSL